MIWLLVKCEDEKTLFESIKWLKLREEARYCQAGCVSQGSLNQGFESEVEGAVNAREE